MTRLAVKKKISDSSVSSIVNKKGGKSLRSSRNPLLSAAIDETHLKRSNRLLKDLKNHGNRIFIFYSMIKLSPFHEAAG